MFVEGMSTSLIAEMYKELAVIELVLLITEELAEMYKELAAIMKLFSMTMLLACSLIGRVVSR